MAVPHRKKGAIRNKELKGDGSEEIFSVMSSWAG